MFWCLNLLSEWKQWKVKARQISQWNQRIVPNPELCTWTTVSWLTNSRVIYKKWSDIFLSFRWLNNMLLKSSDIPFFPSFFFLLHSLIPPRVLSAFHSPTVSPPPSYPPLSLLYSFLSLSVFVIHFFSPPFFISLLPFLPSLFLHL